jgi:hypothetical protein
MTRVETNLQTWKVITLTKNSFKLNFLATVNRKAVAGGGMHVASDKRQKKKNKRCKT